MSSAVSSVITKFLLQEFVVIARSIFNDGATGIVTACILFALFLSFW
jgi:hypothetical protein